jgi:hypothetical protein
MSAPQHGEGAERGSARAEGSGAARWATTGGDRARAVVTGASPRARTRVRAPRRAARRGASVLVIPIGCCPHLDVFRHTALGGADYLSGEYLGTPTGAGTRH